MLITEFEISLSMNLFIDEFSISFTIKQFEKR